jgi:antitoxin HicB
MKTDRLRHLNDYLKLPYTVTLRPDEDGVWVARVEELEGCIAHGNTQAEALAIVEEAKAAWIEDALEAGDPVPVPEQEENLPSGKWLQRVPRSLHKKLGDLAKKEQVSLNQLVTSILAEAIGSKSETKRMSRSVHTGASTKMVAPAERRKRVF